MAKIGTIAPTRREIAPAQGARNPYQGFESVVQSIADQAPAYASIQDQLRTRENVDTGLTLALRDREEKITSSRLTSEFIGLKNGLGRSMLEAYDNAEPGHPGFATQTTAEAQATFDKFMAKVPERLKPQFEADIASAREMLTNQAFDLQVQSENSEFKRGILGYTGDVVEKFNSSVIKNIGDIDAIEAEALAELDKLFENNPLDRASAEVFREEILTGIKAAKLGRLALEEALDNASMGGVAEGKLVKEGAVVKSTGPVVSGLSAPMAGVLMAISGPESGGEYNVMYSPDGRRYFSDFSDHPNNPATIPSGPNAGKQSSAAGKYQFIYSTWKMAQEALGLEDFSPENQDLAAAWYAKKIYKDATGRDLESVLLSGHAPSIAAARQILAADIGWAGLQNQSDAEFVNIVAGATGNPSALLYDEEFSNVPMQDRVAIVNDAMARSDAIRTEQQKAYLAQRTADIDSLKFGLDGGTAGQQDILTAQRKWKLTFEETEGLTKILTDKMGGVIDANRGMTIVTDSNAMFNRDDNDDKKAVAAIFTQTNAATELQAGNQEYVNGVIKPTLQKTDYIPAVLATALVTQMQSSDPRQADFAMQVMADIQQTNGVEAVRAFGKEAVAAAAVYNAGKAYIPQDQLRRFVRNELNGQDQMVVDAREKAITKSMTDAPADFTPVGIASNIGSEAPVDGIAGNALASEFRGLYTYFYTALGDHATARDEAIKMLQTQWGEVTSGDETYLMKNPPALAGVPAFNGSHDWIDRDLRADLKIPAEVGVRLVSDGTTETDIKNGGTPSYSIVVRDSNGLLRGLTLGDTSLYDPREDPPELRSLPLRYTPELNPVVQQRELVKVEEDARYWRGTPQAPITLPDFGQTPSSVGGAVEAAPLTLAPREQKAVSDIARLTGRTDLLDKMTGASTPDQRRQTYNEIMAEINKLPPGPVPLQLRRQLASVFWRYMK